MVGLRSARLTIACMTMATACLMPQHVHGQAVNVAELIQQSDAVVSVEVAFVPYGDLVLIGEVLAGAMVELSSSNELLGQCLPQKALVRDLVKSSRNNPQHAVYAEAIERAGYSAVVFMKHDGDAGQIICDNGAHSTVNWVSDPRYPQWRARLDKILERSR